ncbi:sensor histidine kinase [Streptomyces sp. sk2.1]|nr:histidine kinase [Streptomyces sp. sk2.1]TXS72409.1 sensor histidine kinase [Streptomyces sp. sk2.1]
MLVRGWRRGWQQRSRLERIDLYSRVTVSTMPWFFTLAWQVTPFKSDIRHEPLPLFLGLALLVVSLVQCLLNSLNIRPAYRHYLGTSVFPRRRQLPPLVLILVSLGLLVALVGVDGVNGSGLFLMVINMPTAFATTQTLLVPVRTFLLQALALAALGVGSLAAVGVRGGPLGGVASAVLLSCLIILVSVRPSAWSLGVMWQAEEARDLQARLAVAEERLRFGRDMHDVLGRNLAVIALKSELAAELAQRGRPEAVDQMVEVQRIARTSQQEVRDVVRGYREADLSTELAGARGVLSAAGIECEVRGAIGGELPAPVQAALGWVVREAATNVLRHGDPRHCTIRIGSSADEVVLQVENDGVAAAPDGTAGGLGGSGLAGLRERLRALEGSLDAGPAGDGLFRLTATIPLSGTETRTPSRTKPGAGTEGTGAEGTGAEVTAGTEEARVVPGPAGPTALREERR